MSNPPQQQLSQHHRTMYSPHRSMCFWHSDVQDAIDLLHHAACRYSPSERMAFVTAVCEGALMDFPLVDHSVEATDMIATR